MNNNIHNKAGLRIIAKNKRKTIDIKAISKTIADKIREQDYYKSAKNIMLFYPLEYEINLLELLNDGDKHFYLPKVVLNELSICPFQKGNELKKSLFNVYEPCSDAVPAEMLDLVIVPALLVDKENYRLGYGGGFYDRFLAQNPDIKTAVPIAKEMIVDKLPHEDFDIKIDHVIND